MNCWFKSILNPLALVSLGILSITNVTASTSDINSHIQRLEVEFNDLSADFYQSLAAKNIQKLKSTNGIDQLLNNINALVATNKSISAIQLIYINIQTINENLDTPAVFQIVELLLDKNELQLAIKLLNSIKIEGDQSLLATYKFVFAKYHAKRNEWKEVKYLLDGVFTELADENAAYAYLLYGSALQHLKQHRKAVNNYSKVKSTSAYYNYAQLNTAIANIRQGWWTDAQTKIRSLIKKTGDNNKDEFTNRLYLILGYALLQREYYRDARDAFRHIGVNSQYTNRALLGIGLTATSQGDYIGGLNALTILRDKKTYDLSVDESYLLVPYVYEKLQQELTVNKTYNQAMKYYQSRMINLDLITSQKSIFTELKYNALTSTFTIKDNKFDYGSHYPESFINNYKRLNEFNKQTQSPKSKNNLAKLINKFDVTYQKIIKDLVNQRKDYLKSYLNQSRYGLARLYDSNNENNN